MASAVEEGGAMRVLHVNGCDMAYVERGAGTPLLLIHGSLADHRWWAPQMEPLGRHHRVVAPSLRHYWPARWDGAGGGFTVAQHVADVAAFAAALGAGPVHLVGLSRGGHIAFRVAQHHPERVRTLVLAEPGGALDATLQPPPPPVAAQPHQGMSAAEATARAAERIRVGDVEGGLALFLDAVMGPGAWEGMAEHLKRMLRDNARTLLGQIDERRQPFSRADMEAIRAPTLLIGSGACAPSFARVLDAMERWIGVVARATIPGTTHGMSQDDPDAFNRVVLGFLAERG
jgi:pimeloyl-ACP methyl ester carboxylesterase